MEHIEIILAGLLAAIVALVVLADRLRVPYPIMLVLGGLAIAFVPGVPDVDLDPELVLLIFLPPLLYSGAFFSSLRDLRDNLRPIGLLSVGLVLATVFAVAVLGHEVIGLPWAVAFVLGAIVSPTDPVAALAIASRLGVPRRVSTILEGESLINDATALVAYRVAVVAVVSGSFSAVDAGGRFLLNGLGGLVIGLGVGVIIVAVRRRLDDPPLEITVSLLSGYAGYLPAEELGVSGVVAAVTVGLWLGWRAPQLTTPAMRIQGLAVWEILTFLLNSFLFILIGLQLPTILDGLSGEPVSTLAWYGVLISVVVIGVRIVWVFILTYLPRALMPRLTARDPYPDPRNVAVIAWTGMRGAVSLAAALAVPLTVDSGAPFPERDLLIFLTFCVIFATLVVQGLTLPAIIHLLGIEDDGDHEREENEARLRATRAALQRMSDLTEEEWVFSDSLERMRGMYDYRRRRFEAQFDDGDDGGYEARSSQWARLSREIMAAERQALLELRNGGQISDQVMRRVERDLDLQESQLGDLGSRID